MSAMARNRPTRAGRTALYPSAKEKTMARITEADCQHAVSRMNLNGRIVVDNDHAPGSKAWATMAVEEHTHDQFGRAYAKPQIILEVRRVDRYGNTQHQFIASAKSWPEMYRKLSEMARFWLATQNLDTI